MSAEARLYHIEQQVDQLNQQISLLKQLITTEVMDLRRTSENQVAELKQVVTYQQKVYQDRVNKLEMRIQQLSEFCLHMARSNGFSEASLGVFADDAICRFDFDDFKASSEEALDYKNPVLEKVDDKDDKPLNAVKKVLEKYKKKIDRIYDFYTASNIEVFHPTMSLPHFSHLVKDCQLCGLAQGTSAELLWMSVLRSLNVNQKKGHIQSQLWSLGSTNGNNVPSKLKKNLFAFQRLESIPRHLFGDALAVLAVERHSHTTVRDEATSGNLFTAGTFNEKTDDIVTAFLLHQVFPRVEAVMDEKQQSRHSDMQSLSSMDLGAPDHSILSATHSIQKYKTDVVRNLLREYLGRIKQSFSSTIKLIQGRHDTTMNVDGFVEIARRHELLPLIRKPDLRRIFLICSTAEKERHPEVVEGTISMGTFVLALYYLADKIYGDLLMGDKFPTPESRMKKLLTKMYLLS